MQKYIVTGASGFIGSYLVKVLAEKQQNLVYAVVRDESSDVSKFRKCQDCILSAEGYGKTGSGFE